MCVHMCEGVRAAVASRCCGGVLCVVCVCIVCFLCVLVVLTLFVYPNP